MRRLTQNRLSARNVRRKLNVPWIHHGGEEVVVVDVWVLAVVMPVTFPEADKICHRQITNEIPSEWMI